jgi:hypothetical protein
MEQGLSADFFSGAPRGAEPEAPCGGERLTPPALTKSIRMPSRIRGHKVITNGEWVECPRKAREIEDFLSGIGGRRGDRTPDLCIANAALSQLS